FCHRRAGRQLPWQDQGCPAAFFTGHLCGRTANGRRSHDSGGIPICPGSKYGGGLRKGTSHRGNDRVMKINILTLFPEMCTAVTGSILGRAAEKGLLKFNFVNIRDFSQDKHKKVDDYPFGGGQGMVMMADPVFRALESVEAKGKKLIYMSPRGRVLNKDK